MTSPRDTDIEALEKLTAAFARFAAVMEEEGFIASASVKLRDHTELAWTRGSAGWGVYFVYGPEAEGPEGMKPIAQASIARRVEAAGCLGALVDAAKAAKNEQRTAIDAAIGHVKTVTAMVTGRSEP